MIDSLLNSLFETMCDVSIEKWKDQAAFKSLRLLSHERICRELFWNLECLASRKKDEQRVYLRLLRTEAFDELVQMSAPLDTIFSDPILCLTSIPTRPLSRSLRIRLKGVSRLSRLLDRTYNRIWMLRHRVNNDLTLGDLLYLRQLIRLSYDEVERARRLLSGEAAITEVLPATDLSAGPDVEIW